MRVPLRVADWQPVSVADWLPVGVAVPLREPAPPVVALVDVLVEEGTPGVGEGVGVAREAHTPAVAAVVPPADQHVQAAQPAVCTAAAAQQQPPRQRLVPQAKLLLQASPGPYVRQDPDWKAHTLQPTAMAYWLQQKPPPQTPEAHSESREQARPGR